VDGYVQDEFASDPLSKCLIILNNGQNFTKGQMRGVAGLNYPGSEPEI